jgi:hypothetical protein
VHAAADLLIQRIFANQVQRLVVEANRLHTLELSPRTAQLAYLLGEWNWHTPVVRHGVEMMKILAEDAIDGFAYMARVDLLFQFADSKALLYTHGSWEADSVFSQTPFRVIAFELPFVEPGETGLGADVFGPTGEGIGGLLNAVGLTRTSKHPDQAMDFLRYLTSQPVSARVMEESNRLSSIIGVEPPASLASFKPREDGYPLGFGPVMLYGGECDRLYRAMFYRLIGPNGSIENFVEAMERGYAGAVAADLRRSAQQTLQTARWDDARLTALLFDPVPEGNEAERIDLLREVQTVRELEAAQINQTLRRNAATKSQAR